jgi:hypothetical protein
MINTLEQALLEALDSRFADVHTCMPGRVESYDDVKQTASVAPMLKRVDTDTAGDQAVSEYPVLANVPIVWPRFGGFYIQGPVLVGDFVTLLFAESAIDAFRARGTLTHPGDLRRHSLTGAIAIPGMYPTARALPATAGDLIIGKEDGTEIRIKANGDIHLGASVSSLVALADLVDDRLSTLQTTFDTHTHVCTSSCTAGGATGAVAIPLGLVGPLDSVAADKVHAE